jgi:hypothetical protein
VMEKLVSQKQQKYSLIQTLLNELQQFISLQRFIHSLSNSPKETKFFFNELKQFFF